MPTILRFLQRKPLNVVRVMEPLLQSNSNTPLMMHMLNRPLLLLLRQPVPRLLGRTPHLRIPNPRVYPTSTRNLTEISRRHTILGIMGHLVLFLSVRAPMRMVAMVQNLAFLWLRPEM